MAKHCAAFKEDSTQCKAYAIKGSVYCFAHDPESKEQHIEAVRKGGSVSRFKGLSEVLGVVRGPLGAAALLEQITNKVLTGELPPHVANTAVYSINAMVNAFKVASSTQKASQDLESPVVLVHDEEPERYELVWDFQREQIAARKVEDDDEKDSTDTAESA